MKDSTTSRFDSNTPVIRIRDLVFRRGRKTILEGISLDIPHGSIVAFMGPSGAGKTTILRLISGQLRPRRNTRSLMRMTGVLESIRLVGDSFILFLIMRGDQL